MAKIETINVFPAPKFIDIGDLLDNDKPIFEPIDVVLVPNAFIGYYGYITKNFKNIEFIVSPRHRNTIGFKSIISNYFIKKKIKINSPAISIVNGWYDNFYHFSIECLIKLFILKDYNIDSPIVMPSKLSTFHQEWIDLLEIKNIIYINENEVIDTPLAISSNFPNRDLNHHHIVLPKFRSWILDKVESKQVLNGNKIFVGRKNGSKRNLINQKELVQELKKHGFIYIEMDSFSLIDQINIFRHAEFIIAVHGASLTHLIFCNPKVKVLDLIHENYHVFCFLKLAKILDINYELLFCKGQTSEKTQSGYKDFYADTNAIINQLKKW